MRAALHIATGHGPLHRLRVVAGLSLVAVAGCAGQPGGVATATSGQHAVQIDGQALNVAVQPGPVGTMLTAQGARPVSGQAIRVQSAAGSMAMGQGALAKKAAREGCAMASGRYNEAAIGRFERTANAWIFEGACA